MKHVWKWLTVGLLAVCGVFAAAWAFFGLNRPQVEEGKPLNSTAAAVASPPTIRASNGLAKMKEVAVERGGFEAETNFSQVMLEFLGQHAESLSDADRRRLQSAKDRSGEVDLLEFDEVKRIAELWGNDGNTPNTINAYRIESKAMKTKEADVGATQEGVVATSRDQIERARKRASLLFSTMSKWEDGGAVTAGSGSCFSPAIYAVRGEIEEGLVGEFWDLSERDPCIKKMVAAPQWFPLISRRELALLSAQSALMNHENWKYLLPKENTEFRSLYRENGKPDLSRGLSPDVVRAARRHLEEGQQRFLEAMAQSVQYYRLPKDQADKEPEPDVKLGKKYGSEEGFEEFKAKVNSIYDGLFDLLDSYSEKWPPPARDARGAWIEPIVPKKIPFVARTSLKASLDV